MRILFLVVLVIGALCVDSAKFEKCDKRGFCDRLRNNKEETKFKIDKILRDDKFVYGTLQDERMDKKLFFRVDSYPSGVVRLKISDSELVQDKTVRFRMDFDDEFIKQKTVDLNTITNKATQVKVTTKHDSSATLDKANFALDFVTHNLKLVGFNHRNLLEMEDGKYVPKDENDTTSYGDGEYNGLSFDVNFPGASHLYGIPERAMDYSLEQTDDDGEPYRLYNLDVFEYNINDRMGLYGAIPFLMSITKSGESVGVFHLNPTETFVDVSRKNNEISAHLTSSNGLINLFFIPGPSPKEVIHNFVTLVGMPFMPPKFSIGYHQCRWNYKDEDDVFEVNANFEKHDIPMDVLWLDIEHTDGKKYFTWDSDLFPTPKDMQENLRNHGRKLVTISDPHIKVENGYFVYDEAKKNDFFIKKADGTGPYQGKCWPGDSSWLDFYNPAVREYYSELFRLGTYKGSTDILYTWIDMNEPSVFSGPEVTLEGNVLHHDNVHHREIHNIYGYYHAIAAYKGHITRGYGKHRPFILSRSFFAGSSQYVAIWTGDNEASWEHVRASIPMLISLGISGVPFVGADVGGFFGNPDAELLTRFYQMGLFFPFFRAHGHLETKRREPWLFGDEVTQRIREAIALRYRLIPYYYTLFYHAHVTGIPILRPFFLEFPSDDRGHDYQDGFLVGDGLLGRPVMEEGVKNVDVYFPKGAKWYDFYTGSLVNENGGKKVKQAVTMDSIPLYQKGGSIVVTKDRMRRTTQDMKEDPYSLYIALDRHLAARGELYMDDGDSFEYKKQKMYTMKNFFFVKGELIANATHTGYNSENVLERVVVYGYPKKPKRVMMQIQEEGSDLFQAAMALDFVYDKKGKVLTIKHPNVLMINHFKMKFE